jgi:hypothetical protein
MLKMVNLAILSTKKRSQFNGRIQSLGLLTENTGDSPQDASRQSQKKKLKTNPIFALNQERLAIDYMLCGEAVPAKLWN